MRRNLLEVCEVVIFPFPVFFHRLLVSAFNHDWYKMGVTPNNPTILSSRVAQFGWAALLAYSG